MELKEQSRIPCHCPNSYVVPEYAGGVSWHHFPESERQYRAFRRRRRSALGSESSLGERTETTRDSIPGLCRYPFLMSIEHRACMRVAWIASRGCMDVGQSAEQFWTRRCLSLSGWSCVTLGSLRVGADVFMLLIANKNLLKGI